MFAPLYSDSIVKDITPKNVRWIHCSTQEILLNESLCLLRVKGVEGFPEIYNTDWLDNKITMSYCGRTLHWHWKRGVVPVVHNPLESLENLFNELTKRGLTHLDIHPSGKNICVSDGKLSIIDFGMCVRDNTPLSKQLKTLYDAWVDRGGYEYDIHVVLSSIHRRCIIKKV